MPAQKLEEEVKNSLTTLEISSNRRAQVRGIHSDKVDDLVQNKE
jgi:hypothetical protein